VARMILSEEINDNNPNKAELFDNNYGNNELPIFALLPFDVINIRKMWRSTKIGDSNHQLKTVNYAEIRFSRQRKRKFTIL
jgi:hypothetical protein